MKFLRFLPLLVFGFLAAFAFAAEAPAPVAPAPKPPTALPLSPRFKQVRERIDALFLLRNEAPAAPDLRANPFRAAGQAMVPENSGATASSPGTIPAIADQPSGDLAVLQQAVANLKITGVVSLGGESLVGINSKLYKKGDVVQANAQGQIVYIRVRDISGRAATLALNAAEMTLKF